MSETEEKQFLSRRSALKILAGSSGVAVTFPILNNKVLAGATHTHPHLARAVPTASNPSVLFKPKFFTKLENEMVTTISELIIPADEKSPGAKEARVNEFIDLMISESEAKEKKFWREALEALDRKAEQQFGKKFLQVGPDRQITLLEEISRNEDNPQTLEERFFKEIKTKTVQGYYTSEIGIHQDLEYKGNTVLPEFEGCTHPEHGA